MKDRRVGGRKPKADERWMGMKAGGWTGRGKMGRVWWRAGREVEREQAGLNDYHHPPLKSYDAAFLVQPVESVRTSLLQLAATFVVRFA